MKTVRALGEGDGMLWAATAGGCFSYDPQSSAFRKFTNSEGISSNDLTAITLDQTGAVWVGASDGSLNVLEGTWRDIRDIAVSNNIKRSIKKIVQRGDTMFVASDFGISVYMMSKKEFGDTYSNFGFSTPAVVNSVLIHGNRIWVATNQGVATALRGALTLTWTRYSTTKGLPSSNAACLSVFLDTVVIGCSNGAAFFSADSFVTLNAFAGKEIVDMEVRAGTLLFLSNSNNNFAIESLSNVVGNIQVVALQTGMRGNDLLAPPTSSILSVSTSTNGVARWNGASWSYLNPNGPNSNLFISVAVDHDGVVWAGTGLNGGGKGFSRYDPSLPEGEQWKNFSNAQFPALRFDDYYKVSVAGSSVWVSSWGRGVLEIVQDSIRRRIHTTSTPSLESSVPNDSFVVVGGVALDEAGTAWFANRTAVSGNYLAQLVNDTTFVYYRNGYNSSEGYFAGLVIDREGTKWLANSEPGVKNPRGLYFFNERKVVSGTQITEGWGFLSTSDGLPNASVMSLAVDATGDVWVGTDLGVLIITDPLFPKTRRTSAFPLREQSVQSIAVDGLNNKWVGTREGVFVLNADGTQLLAQHTVLTTGGKLVSDDVRSIAIDQRKGIVYFGTEKGLSSLNIAAVASQETFTALEIGPNPYLVPNDEQLVISDLVDNTTVKILTTTGSLVLQFKAQGGGRAFWDGKDVRGNLVSTGVYFVVAFADNGNQIATGKVVVVRR